MIISRYLIKDVFQTLLAVTSILLLILLSNQLIRYLNYAATGKIGANIVFQLLSFEAPDLLAILLPLGLYMGVLLVYGRLYADSELRVMHACGLGVRNLIWITSGIALAVSGILVVLMFWINPIISIEKEKLLARASGTDNIFETLMPGRFQVINEGKKVIYAEKISRNHKEATNIFVADQTKNTGNDFPHWSVISASHGLQMKDAISHDRFVTTSDGFRYEGVPGENAYKIMQFKKYSVRIGDSFNLNQKRTNAFSTLKLMRAYDIPNNAAELQWRFAVPISAFLLAMLAIPISQIQPRQSRYGVLFPAILIYIIYLNLLFVSRNLIEQKLISTNLGMWWVHGLFLLLVLVALWKRAEWRWRYL